MQNIRQVTEKNFEIKVRKINKNKNWKEKIIWNSESGCIKVNDEYREWKTVKESIESGEKNRLEFNSLLYEKT